MKQREKNGKFRKTAKWVDKICENCGVVFQVKESDLKYGRGKCCSRNCVDENKKNTYKGTKNPMYGKHHTDEEKSRRRTFMKDMWENNTKYRDDFYKGQQRFLERASKDGTWDRANEKREQFWLKKIGKKHNWNGKYGERQCDKTFVENNGITSIEYASNMLHTYRTSIEILTESILNENNIKNIPQYKYKGYSFDFYLPDENILIECDGDYWHGYGKLDEDLDYNQLRSRNNDKIKNKLAKSGNIKLLRFWEHEIHQEDFEIVLLNSIWEKK